MVARASASTSFRSFGDVCELTADILKSLLLKEFVNHRITLRVAIDCYCSLFLILIIFVLYVELIDLNVEDEYDEDEEEGTITIYGDPKSYAMIHKFLEEKGFEDIGGEFTYIPNDLKDVDADARATIDKMVERLEDFDDVQNVYTNMKPLEVEE